MSLKIRISAGEIVAEAELNNTRTAKSIWQNLPLEGFADTWGEEIYFEIPVSEPFDDTARDPEQASIDAGRRRLLAQGRLEAP